MGCKKGEEVGGGKGEVNCGGEDVEDAEGVGQEECFGWGELEVFFVFEWGGGCGLCRLRWWSLLGVTCKAIRLF